MAKRPRKKISDRHLLLVDCYFGNGFNQTKAAEEAGFKHANGYVARLFSRPDVKEEIAKRQRRLRKVNELDEQWVVERLMRLADVSFGEIMLKLRENDYDLTVLTEDELYSLSELTDEINVTGRGDEKLSIRKVKVRVESRMQSLIALCRKLGLFTDNVNVTGEISLAERLQRGRDRVRQQREKETEDEGQ